MKQLTPEHQVNIRCVRGIETLLSEHFGNRSSQDLNQVGMSPGMWWSRVGRVRVPHAGGDEPCPTGIPHGRTVGETALGPLWMEKVIGWLDLESFERQIELAYAPSRHHAKNRRGCLLSRTAGRLYSRAERAAYRRSRLHRGADILPPHTIGATPEDSAGGLPIFCR